MCDNRRVVNITRLTLYYALYLALKQSVKILMLMY